MSTATVDTYGVSVTSEADDDANIGKPGKLGKVGEIGNKVGAGMARPRLDPPPGVPKLTWHDLKRAAGRGNTQAIAEMFRLWQLAGGSASGLGPAYAGMPHHTAVLLRELDCDLDCVMRRHAHNLPMSDEEARIITLATKYKDTDR